MKRAFIPLLVFAMASSAYADIMISVNGTLDIDEVTISVSDVVTIDVYNAGGTTPVDFQAYLDFYYKSDGAYSLSNPRVPGGGPPIIDFSIVPDPPYDNDEFWITVFWQPGEPEVPGEIFFVDLHCELPYKDVLVELYDSRVDGGYTIVDSLIIHQIPEPATLLLLGLGGLLLRKKK